MNGTVRCALYPKLTFADVDSLSTAASQNAVTVDELVADIINAWCAKNRAPLATTTKLPAWEAVNGV